MNENQNPYASPLCYGPRQGSFPKRFALSLARAFAAAAILSGACNAIIAGVLASRFHLAFFLYLMLAILGLGGGLRLWQGSAIFLEPKDNQPMRPTILIILIAAVGSVSWIVSGN